MASIVTLLCVISTNCTLCDISLTISENLPTFASSSGASTSSSRQKGAGDELPGFTVKKVNPDGLTLEADGREFTLPLYAGGPNAAQGATLRTVVTPAQPNAQQQPKNAVSPAPGPAVPSSPAASPRLPPRRYPRTYVPGRR